MLAYTEWLGGMASSVLFPYFIKGIIMAKKKKKIKKPIKKAEVKKEIKPDPPFLATELIKDIGVTKELVFENQRVIKMLEKDIIWLKQRIDRIVAAIDKSRSVRGL